MPLSAGTAISRALFLSFTALVGFVGVQLFARVPHHEETAQAEFKVRVRTPAKKEAPKPEFPPGYNHALAANGAMAIGGRDAGILIDGDDTHYTGGTGFGMTQWNAEPPQSFVITLKKPVDLDCIRFLLWDRSEERYYRYKIEVSPNDKNTDWSIIADQTGPIVQCKGWQTLRFAPCKVHQIKLTGTFNSANNGFHVVELTASLGLPPSDEPDATPPTEALDF
jgi:hypothetical protein